MHEEKVNRRKSWAARRIAAQTLEYISLMVMICAATISIGMMNPLESLQNGFDKPFVETTNYQNLAVKQINRLYNYLTSCIKFETSGDYDSKRIVDITDYAEGGVVTGENTNGIAYYLGDLIRWAQQGLNASYMSSENRETRIYELYTPIGYKSIDDYIQENGGDKEQIFQALSYTVEHIWIEVSNYNKSKMLFAGKNTNLKYKIYDKNNNILFKNSELADKEIMELDTYIAMDYSNLEFNTNLKVQDKLYDGLQRNISPEFIDSRIVIGIDTSFPIMDEFYDMKQRYDIMTPWSHLMVIIFIISFIVWQISLSYIPYTLRKDKKGLFEIDTIPFEALTLLFVVIGGLGGYIAYVSYNNLAVFQGLIGILLGIAGFSNGIFMVWYTSLVRRIEYKVFCRYCGLYVLLGRLKKIDYKNKLMARVLSWYIGFLAVSILCITFVNKFGSVGIVITIFLDLAVGFKILFILVQQNKITEGIEHIIDGEFNVKLETSSFSASNKDIAESVNLLSAGVKKIITENIKNERLKTDLITNVSHDIKTPLTSIINYVGLLKNLNIQDEKVITYLDILDQKSQRLKFLTEDLIEASRVSSGNVKLKNVNISFKELILQTNGEFQDKFKRRDLELVLTMPEFPVIIRGDSKCMWRIIENLYTNAAKYAMAGTRVYADIKTDEDFLYFSIKNISEEALNIEADELTERFVRGDTSRSTEGSGLGLSISKSLTEMQKGSFSIYLDGDLFKVTLSFPIIHKVI